MSEYRGAPGRVTMTRVFKSGVTLIELLVALTLLVVTAAVVGITIPRRGPPTASDMAARALLEVRRAATGSGQSVSTTIVVAGTPHAATALPDGSIVADSEVAVDRLAGVRVAPRVAFRAGRAQ